MKHKREDLHIFLFLVGLVLIVLGGILYLHGPTRFLNYENGEIGTWSQEIKEFDQKEIVSIEVLEDNENGAIVTFNDEEKL